MRRSISFKRNVEVDIVNMVKLTPDFVGITFYFLTELTFKLAMNATTANDEEGMYYLSN